MNTKYKNKHAPTKGRAFYIPEMFIFPQSVRVMKRRYGHHGR